MSAWLRFLIQRMHPHLYIDSNDVLRWRFQSLPYILANRLYNCQAVSRAFFCTRWQTISRGDQSARCVSDAPLQPPQSPLLEYNKLLYKILHMLSALAQTSKPNKNWDPLADYFSVTGWGGCEFGW